LTKYVRDFAALLAFAAVIVGLDQWSKALVRAQLDMGEMWSPWEWLTPYARVIHIDNSGAAFGIFQNGGMFFTIMAVVVALIILVYFPQIPEEDWAFRLALGMQLGGAVGNLIDRLRFGAVTDFISVGTFPVFNIADSSITVGVGVLLLAMWIKERQEHNKPAEAQAEGEDAGNLPVDSETE
jgi:signal peptidase II